MSKDDHYSMLGMPIPKTADDPSLTPDLLKCAYRKALLQNHPDRKSEQEPSSKTTVDQIIEAYATLANRTTRIQYHEELLKQKTSLDIIKATERSAVEVVDLEELEYLDSSEGGQWKKSCRCGNEYSVNEKQLDEAAADGELVTSCHGCSLSIKIVFDAVETQP